MSLLGRPVKRGGRFSMKDVMPSRASAERPVCHMPSESMRCASRGWPAPSMRQSIWRMRATETAAVLSAISRASARAAGSSASGSSTRLTRPPARASSAENTRPVYVHSAACATPTSRGRNHVLAASGTTPRRANTKPIFAVLAARRTSIGSVSVMPKPTAFSRSGRLSVSVAIPSATSYSSVSKLMRRSKAQRPDVLAGGGDGGLRRGGHLDLEPLELRQDFLREEPHVALGLLVRHAGVGEDADIVAVAGAAMDVEDLLVALLGRARDLKVHEV